MPLSPLLFAPEAYGIWRAQIEDAPELMWQPILERFRGGAGVSAPDYVAAWESLARVRRKWYSNLVCRYWVFVMACKPCANSLAVKLSQVLCMSLAMQK